MKWNKQIAFFLIDIQSKWELVILLIAEVP